ncbi:general stress protein [Microbacterium sp.]|uniref:general stress protein n=1 Tax=Microbacterium sp. TaxID=51671 RepID=UPI00261A0349|nr:general stress protein [Microbacterium sp.]
MSMLNRPAGSAAVGDTVASVRDYEAAQKTVSKLIAGDVPARHIAIVGQGVRTIERITGRLGYATAARQGAVNGVLIGLLLSAILVIGNPDVPMQLFLGYIFIGVALGMILSLITYAIVRRRRDYASVTQLAADHYEVAVQADSLAKAREVLGKAQRTEVVRPPVNLDEPPRYGERIAPGSETSAVPQSPAAQPDTTDAQQVGGHVIPPRPADPVPRYGERIAPDAPAADAPASDPAPDAAPSADGPDPAPDAAPSAPDAAPDEGTPKRDDA